MVYVLKGNPIIMAADATFHIACGECGAKLNVKAKLAGRTANCPKCGKQIQIPIDLGSSNKTKPPIPPATDRQKEYAKSLGIDFPPDINRRDISELIDKVVTERDTERYETLEALDKKEGELWEQAKAEVIAEMASDDLPLSKASPEQIVEALDDRGLASLLITIPWDDIIDFEDLTGVKAQTYLPDSMTVEDFHAIIIQFASNIMKHRG